MIYRTRRRGLGLAAAGGVCALALAGVAQAQTTTSADSAVASGGSSVSEVVVTAKKRVEDVRDVPEEVTVVSSQFIDQLHATDLEDIAGYVPGLEVTPGGALDLNASVRNGRYTVRLFGKNMTDSHAYKSYTTIGGPQIEGVLIQPRTVGVAVDATF